MNQRGAAAALLSQHRRLRSVLGRYATGVTVITTVHDGARVGVTVNSFTSLSLDPPLVLWCLHRNSATGPAFTTAPYFAVNILAADQTEVAIRFASPVERFHGVPARTGRHGLPVLEGTVAAIICQRDRVLDGGDHYVLFGAVQEYESAAGRPLVFLDGGYQPAPSTAIGPPIGGLRERMAAWLGRPQIIASTRIWPDGGR